MRMRIRMPACPHARMPVCPYARMPVCPYARMPVCPYARMPVCPYARMPVCPYARMPVCPYVRMRLCLSVYVYVYMYVYVYVYVYVHVHVHVYDLCMGMGMCMCMCMCTCSCMCMCMCVSLCVCVCVCVRVCVASRLRNLAADRAGATAVCEEGGTRTIQCAGFDRLRIACGCSRLQEVGKCSESCEILDPRTCRQQRPFCFRMGTTSRAVQFVRYVALLCSMPVQGVRPAVDRVISLGSDVCCCKEYGGVDELVNDSQIYPYC